AMGNRLLPLVARLAVRGRVYDHVGLLLADECRNAGRLWFFAIAGSESVGFCSEPSLSPTLTGRFFTALVAVARTNDRRLFVRSRIRNVIRLDSLEQPTEGVRYFLVIFYDRRYWHRHTERAGFVETCRSIRKMS